MYRPSIYFLKEERNPRIVIVIYCIFERPNQLSQELEYLN